MMQKYATRCFGMRLGWYRLMLRGVADEINREQHQKINYLKKNRSQNYILLNQPLLRCKALFLIPLAYRYQYCPLIAERP
jgi:hypothetical protein